MTLLIGSYNRDWPGGLELPYWKLLCQSSLPPLRSHLEIFVTVTKKKRSRYTRGNNCMIYQYWNGLFDDSLRITTSAGAWCWSCIRVMWQGVGDNMEHTLMDPVTWLWNCSWRSRLCSWARMISMIFLEINIAVMCSVLVEPTVAVDESLHLDTPKLLTNTKNPRI